MIIKQYAIGFTFRHVLAWFYSRFPILSVAQLITFNLQIVIQVSAHGSLCTAQNANRKTQQVTHAVGTDTATIHHRCWHLNFELVKT